MTLTESVTPVDYLRAVLQRWRLVALIVALCAATALAVSLSSEKLYDATALLLLRTQEPTDALNSTGGGSSRDPERDLNTEVELIKVGPTADLVRATLELDRSRDDLLDQVEVTTSSTSDLVELRVRDPDPVLAARIANSFADAYVQSRVDSARERYREAADLAKRQLLALSSAERATAQGVELQARQRDLAIAAGLQTGGAKVVRSASVPTTASQPRPKTTTAIGLFLGLVLGIGAALALNLIDRRMKNELEVEQLFDMPILAAIPRPARRTTGFDDPAQREAYGLLAANLRLGSVENDNDVIMITSPSPGDGKTSVTIGVARAYARLGLSVVVIEADLRRPSFARYADVSHSTGVTGVLAGSTLDSALLWLDADTLYQSAGNASVRGAIGILPAGTVPKNPQRALSDPKMRLLVDATRQMADIVLVDSAPLGTVNDATILAPLVDTIALVARLNHTTKDAARRAVRTVENVSTRALGVIVTDAGAPERHVYESSNSAAAPTGVLAARGAQSRG